MVDPSKGDIEDDASSTKQRSLFSLAGTLLAEISFSKLAVAWILLVGLPGLLIGAAPLLASIWIASVLSKASALLSGLWPALLLLALVVIGWFGGRPLLRLAESSFWSLNALAVQPGYVLCREGFRHIAERLLPSDMTDDQRAITRAASAAVSGLVICGLALWLVALAWPSSRWVGNLSDLRSPYRLVVPALFNSAVLVVSYLAVAALIWGTADATMAQPRDHKFFPPSPVADRIWRVVHLSDIHVVGERYGFRIESGRSGPRGNERFKQTLAQLNRIHAESPLDVILITGDVTDAGRSAEWAEFFDALAPYRQLSELLLFLPGNHDLNVVDRANPARLDLPTSPKKRLRQIRTISALEALQGSRVRLVDSRNGRLGASLSEALKPHFEDIAAFADRGSFRLSRSLAELWATSFPMVQPPETENGLGIILLNSNVEAHFSFTNALGLVSTEQARDRHHRRSLPPSLLDRGAPSPCCRISQARKSAVRAYRHGSHQWELVRSSSPTTCRPRSCDARPSSRRLDGQVRRSVDCIRAIPRHGSDRRVRDIFLYPYASHRRRRPSQPDEAGTHRCGRPTGRRGEAVGRGAPKDGELIAPYAYQRSTKRREA
jgi:hypothetical protein